MGSGDITEVLNILMGLKLTTIIHSTLIGSRTSTTGIAIIGPAGSGKSTYAYNAAKAAYLRLKCHKSQIPKVNECIKYAVDNYDLCFSSGCKEPDEIDWELRDYIFVGEEDIPRLVSIGTEIVEQRRSPLPFLFIDDVMIRGTYTLGGVYRQLAYLFKKSMQYRRALASLVILTTTTRSSLIDLYGDFIFIHAQERFYDYYYIRWYTAKVPYRMVDRALRVYETYKALVRPEWTDTIPKKKAFGMPAWLEDLINKRKIGMIRTALSKYEKATQAEQRELGESDEEGK